MVIIQQTMTTGFQKSANTVQQIQLPHPGIINSTDFAAHFDLRCYSPSPDLQPFVVHIWTQRTRHPLEPSYKPPVEILSGPSAYLFFTKESAFIHGVSRLTFQYDPRTANVIAGVKFRPGGFYPFLRQAGAKLGTATVPATEVFPQATQAFTEALLALPDHMIVHTIENLLRSCHPKSDHNLHLVGQIVNAIATNSSLRTVSAVAQAFSVSERSLQLLFQTHVGVGVKWVITRARLLGAIERAQNQPQRTWIEIAVELGYSSQSHFSREFKEVTGLSPSEYVRQGR